MNTPILRAEIRSEHDVCLSRQRAREIAGLVGFDEQDQTRIGTAVSEIAHNAWGYAAGGEISFLLRRTVSQQTLQIEIQDEGPGIADIPAVMRGGTSSTGMGLGIPGANRLMDYLDIKSVPGSGTTVVLQKRLPPGAAVITEQDAARITAELTEQAPQAPLREIQHQNHELLRTLEELYKRQQEVTQMNTELEETNRGMIALYSEIEEKNRQLQEADRLKSIFLASMSHELRTPLNSIIGFTGILLQEMVGRLNEEQKKQLTMVKGSGQHLLDLINDLLDVSKIEAGKADVSVEEFALADVANEVTEAISPAATNKELDVVTKLQDDIVLLSDRRRVKQVLTNLVSNAVKFTDHGQVTVTGKQLEKEQVEFQVSDTGIGMKREDIQRLFQPFQQLDQSLTREDEGTGLGLYLCRKIIDLLGGTIKAESDYGTGSTFTATLPLQHESGKTRRVSEDPGS